MIQPLQHQSDSYFDDAYCSLRQRHYRLLAIVLLGLRHAMRAIVIAWPFYLLAIVPVVMPVTFGWWVVFFLAPAVAVLIASLYRGVTRDYRALISGRLLQGSKLHKLLWWGF